MLVIRSLLALPVNYSISGHNAKEFVLAGALLPLHVSFIDCSPKLLWLLYIKAVVTFKWQKNINNSDLPNKVFHSPALLTNSRIFPVFSIPDLFMIKYPPPPLFFKVPILCPSIKITNPGNAPAQNLSFATPCKISETSPTAGSCIF